MKWYGYVIIVLVALSCEKPINYNEVNDKVLSEMKPPVILIGKTKSWAGYSVTVKDSLGRIESFGNLSIQGNSIGESRHIGDTIK